MLPLFAEKTEGKLSEDAQTVVYESYENTLEYALSFEGIKEILPTFSKRININKVITLL